MHLKKPQAIFCGLVWTAAVPLCGWHAARKSEPRLYALCDRASKKHSREDSKETRDSKGKQQRPGSQFSNSFQSAAERRLLTLFQTLSEIEQQRLIADLEARVGQRQRNLRNDGD